jgi:hypothetical protein
MRDHPSRYERESQKCPHCQEGWQHPSAERPGRLVCNICGRYDGSELPKALYVWIVPSETMLDQPGSWRIRKWDTEPFPEATHTALPSEIGAFEQKYPRVIKSTDCHCPSCGHNRCASATSSIDNEDGTHYCQRCSAEWREVP